jgi:hypothetical protein
MIVALTLTYKSTAEEIDNFYNQPAGTIARWEDDFESLAIRLQEDCQIKYTGVFKIRSITIGTDLYTLYGPGYIIITANSLVSK